MYHLYHPYYGKHWDYGAPSYLLWMMLCRKVLPHWCFTLCLHWFSLCSHKSFYIFEPLSFSDKRICFSKSFVHNNYVSTWNYLQNRTKGIPQNRLLTLVQWCLLQTLSLEFVNNKYHSKMSGLEKTMLFLKKATGSQVNWICTPCAGAVFVCFPFLKSYGEYF